MMMIMLIGLIFIFGLCIGSFLNVCIYRLPRDMSVAFPRSHCTNCQNKIAWYDNIPLLSIAVLKFRCRFCKMPISIRYPLIELIAGLTGVVFAWTYFSGGYTFSYALLAALCSFSFIVIFFIDLDYFIIPNEITYGGIVLGLIGSIISPANIEAGTALQGFLLSCLGIAVGGGFLYGVAVIAEWILKKEAMGMGDVKLMGMMGAMFGWKIALGTIFLGSLIGTMVGGGMMLTGRLKKGEHIPFGPYLTVAGFIMILWGHAMIDWYLKLVIPSRTL
ncbi:MAG: prepilin peptidase [Chlamydiota bacterium]|nr:prepilin peptidase [Chlamydiota bacterium]